MVDAARQMLDELMGRNRNLHPSEAPKVIIHKNYTKKYIFLIHVFYDFTFVDCKLGRS